MLFWVRQNLNDSYSLFYLFWKKCMVLLWGKGRKEEKENACSWLRKGVLILILVRWIFFFLTDWFDVFFFFFKCGSMYATMSFSQNEYIQVHPPNSSLIFSFSSFWFLPFLFWYYEEIIRVHSPKIMSGNFQ